MNLNQIPTSIANDIASHRFTKDKVGKSASNVLLFDEFVLKITEWDVEAKQELKMLTWLQDKLPVPKMLHHDIQDGKSFLLMSKIKGVMSCDEQFMVQPNLLVAHLVEGLNLLWNVDITDCPVQMTLEHKLKLAEYKVANNLVNVEDAEPGTFSAQSFRNPEQLLIWLQNNKPKEEFVFSHGDFCLPNMMLHEQKISGFIDLGRCGIADKWQDIALCYRSLNHNFTGCDTQKRDDSFWCSLLFEQLGIEKDDEKLRYYILLDELF